MSTASDCRVLPRAALKRGELFFATLKSESSELNNILCQLSKIDLSTRKASIYFYPTPEQAVWFWGNSLFDFQGKITRHGGPTRIHGSNVWIKRQPAQSFQAVISFYTDCSGEISDLVETHEGATPRLPKSKYLAVFYITPCFAATITGTKEDDQKLARKYKYQAPKRLALNLEDAKAEFRAIDYGLSNARNVDRTKKPMLLLLRGIKDIEKAETLAKALTLLASFASREWSVVHGYTFTAGDCRLIDRRYFNRRFLKHNANQPLLLHDRDACFEFLKTAMKVWSTSLRPELLDSAIYSVLPRERTLESSIVSQFSGLQAALVFGLNKAARKNQAAMFKPTFREFQSKFNLDASDLWPLLDSTMGLSLYDIRNALVHGDIFTPGEYRALSLASLNLQILLERVILRALHWDVSKSYASPSHVLRTGISAWREEIHTLGRTSLKNVTLQPEP